MNISLTGKTAVVCGSTKVWFIIEQLASQGAGSCVGSQNTEKLSEVVKTLSIEQGQVHIATAFTSPAAVNAIENI
jgi:hypothetical protein